MSRESTVEVDSQSNGCFKGSAYEVMADCWQRILLLRGVPPRDTTNMACIRLNECICELMKEEDITRGQLKNLVGTVKGMDVKRHKSELRNNVIRSRQLRENLGSISRKRQAMQQHLDTLRQSKLNQAMLQSMKHTNDALQTLGLKVADADTIMLDLEDNVQDASSLQSSLATPFEANAATEEEMEEELLLLLSDDPYVVQTTAPSRPVPAVPAVSAVPVEEKNENDDMADQEKDKGQEESLDKQEEPEEENKESDEDGQQGQDAQMMTVPIYQPVQSDAQPGTVEQKVEFIQS